MLIKFNILLNILYYKLLLIDIYRKQSIACTTLFFRNAYLLHVLWKTKVAWMERCTWYSMDPSRSSSSTVG